MGMSRPAYIGEATPTGGTITTPDVGLPQMPEESTSLGTAIRLRREAKGMSMDALSQAAGVGRSTLHRIEHGQGPRARAFKLARVMSILDFDPAEIGGLIDDREYADQVADWIRRDDNVGDVQDFLFKRAAKAAAGKPDLVILEPDDGTVIYVEVKSMGLKWEDEGRDKLVQALGRMGYVVTSVIE